jgi:WD40 repeat protein
LLAWVDHNDSLCLWDLENGRKIPFPGPPLVSSCWGGIALYPDSDHLTFPSATGMTETWDRRTMRKVFVWGKGEGVNVSPGGRWVMGPHPAQTLWSSQTGSPVFSLPQERGVIWSSALSQDGDRVAVGLADGGLALWNVPKIQAQLAQIGLAWRADAQPAPQPAEGRNAAFRAHDSP